MSIVDCIQECIAGGELVELLPLIPGTLCLRKVLANHHVLKFLHADKQMPSSLMKKAVDAMVALNRFTSGARISVAMDPMEKLVRTELARVNIKESIWDFRIRDPQPQVRVFGLFAAKDTFVALHYAPRNNLDFKAAAATTKQQWTDLFGDLPPVTGDDINDYISDKYELV